MTEVIYHDRQYEIEPAQLQDAVGIGRAHLQSWLETYPNEEYGVTEEWIESELGFLANEQGDKFRENVIQNLDDNTLYKVVKDENDEVQGFLHVDKNGTEARLNAIYLKKELKGSGVAQQLMKDTLEFVGDLDITLEVAAYNDRAIRFYENHGFVKGELVPELFHDKIPILQMKRIGEAAS